MPNSSWKKRMRKRRAKLKQKSTGDVIGENNCKVEETANISDNNLNSLVNTSTKQTIITAPQKCKKETYEKHPYIIEMMKRREALNKLKNDRKQQNELIKSQEIMNRPEGEQAITANKPEDANSLIDKTQTNKPNEDDVPVPKVLASTSMTPEEATASYVKPKIDEKTVETRPTNETHQREKHAVMPPEHASASEVEPKIDVKTIEIRLTNETRQKEKHIVYRGNNTNIKLCKKQKTAPVKQRFPENSVIPQQNVPPTVIPYDQNQVYMNPIQNNQQYFDVTQQNQFLPSQPMQPNQFHTQHGFVQTPHTNQPVSFGHKINETSSSAVPTYIYPKGIPKSFYQGQDANFLGNSITLNQNAAQDTSHLIPQASSMLQHSFVYTKNVPVMATPIYTENKVTATQQLYSPSQLYTNTSSVDEDIREVSETTDISESGHKRLSAFERLGPMTTPKKPKLTINLMVNEENSVREVVDDSKEKAKDNKYTPVHLREDILTSTDPTVLKHIKSWPWKKQVHSHKSVTARNSKTVMLLEREQMNEYYESEHFNQVSVKGYPSTWTKEDVLDTVLESVRGCPMIPCFIEFLEEECKFLVYRSRSALLAIHKYGFTIRKNDVELIITISNPDLEDSSIDLVPTTVLKQRLSMCYDGETKLNLSEFTTKNDISHFLYYPLNRLTNQAELTKLQNVVIWGFLLELDLSHNRITSINGFYLSQTTPKLRHLNLSHNLIEKVTVLLCCKELPLRSIRLEGNPMCTDYTDPQHYVKVIKMIFSGVTEIDGLPVCKGKLPASQSNYCPDEAKSVVEKFLEVYFPLWDAPYDQRGLIKDLYESTATFTGSFTTKLRYGKVHRLFPTLFQRTRMVYETECESETVEGNKAIAKFVKKWPELEHDPLTFKVDVIYHDENTTIVIIRGVLKLTAKSLADEEHLLSFTRTVILKTVDGYEYKISREWTLWDEPREELAKTAFQITTVKTKHISLEMKSPPNSELKEKLIEIFMQITTIDRKPSKRCLEIKNWHLKHALEYFSKLLKLGDITCLSRDK